MFENHVIIKRIATDLHMRKYDRESHNSYVARVIYSALSMWIRFATLDENIFVDPLKQIGASKIYILNSCKPFFENMINLYPIAKKWFYPEGFGNDPIAITRDRLYSGGELVDVGFSMDLALPKYEECNIDDENMVIRGISDEGLQKVTGLAQIRRFSRDTNSKCKNIFEFYGLKEKRAYEFLQNYVKHVKWGRTGGSYKIFNKYSSHSFYNCWEKDYDLVEDDISLYRKDFFDFGFIIKQDNSIYISEIEKYLIEEKEIRRFMYALKYAAGNPVTANYRRDNESGLVELNLYNALPQKEEDILMLLGWPVKGINDKYNLLFHESVWSFIELVLKNLNMVLKEAI